MRNKNIETLLQQNISEKFLVVYLNELSDVYGTEVAAETAIEKDSIKDSISSYTTCSLKNSTNELDLQLAVLRNIVLSNVSDSRTLTYVREQIALGNIEGLLQDMESSIFLKRTLMVHFAESSCVTPKQAYDESDEKDRVYKELIMIDRYRTKRLKAEKEKTKAKKLAE